MYGFVFLLITKEVIQLKTIIMIFTESDETTWKG